MKRYRILSRWGPALLLQGEAVTPPGKVLFLRLPSRQVGAGCISEKGRVSGEFPTLKEMIGSIGVHIHPVKSLPTENRSESIPSAPVSGHPLKIAWRKKRPGSL